MRVAVIGAGPSGLVALKCLLSAHKFHRTEPIEARLFEAKDSIAGTFRYRVYEDAEVPCHLLFFPFYQPFVPKNHCLESTDILKLVSSKYLTTFSDFRCLKDDPDFLPTSSYCAYLEAYSTHFGLWSHINLSTPVKHVRRRAPNTHVITYSKNGSDYEWECDAVAICSGLHVDPYIPSVEGIENVPLVIHSSQFKGRKDFGEGKHVMVLGAGETAMDVSHLAVTSSTKCVTMCHRDGFLYAAKVRCKNPEVVVANEKQVVPRPIINGHLYSSLEEQRNIPTDTTIMSLFDTAYVHPILQKSSLLWDYYDFFVKRVFQLISGTKHGCDQWVGGISDERFHVSRVFLCKSGKAIPYISAPYRKQSYLNRLRAKYINVPIPDTGGRTIDLAPWPKLINSNGIVEFRENGRPEAERMRSIVCKPDMIIFATGYSQNFPFLDSSYGTPDQADRRGIWKTGDETVGFIGFVRPSIGAIPPLSELQAQLWTLSLLKLLPADPPRDIDYKLKMPSGRRAYEIFGVDHESYAYQLALDMGSAPSFTEVLGFGFKVAFTWAFGSNFNTKFRLVGPWKWDGASEIMRTELWDVVKKSGGWFCEFPSLDLKWMVN